MPMLMGLTLDMKMGKSRPAEHCFSPFNILFRAPCLELWRNMKLVLLWDPYCSIVSACHLLQVLFCTSFFHATSGVKDFC